MYYELAIKATPSTLVSHAHAHASLGELLLAECDLEEAKKQFQEALLLDPMHAGALQGVEFLASCV